MEPTKYYHVDLSSQQGTLVVTVSKIKAKGGKEAGEAALALMAKPEEWLVVGIDRV